MTWILIAFLGGLALGTACGMVVMCLLAISSRPVDY